MLSRGVVLGQRYRLLGVVGEGSMGTVYEAEHVRLARRVAVKVLHARYSRNERAVRRFEREARAAAALGHPNIVEATDFGLNGDQPWFVMELLRGEELSARLGRDRGPMPVTEACRIVGQVLSALAAAHARGIVHRDLKPENIYLDRGVDGAERVKLLDFGLSKFRRGDGGSVLETQDGVLMGTPAYMAPEQWLGRRDIDHRADLFSAGAVLYELLTGTVPYDGETQGEIFQRTVNGSDAPSAPDVLRADVPAELSAIVLTAIARDRDARYPTAQAFLEALGPHGASGIAVTDAPPASEPLVADDEFASIPPDAQRKESRARRAVPAPASTLSSPVIRRASVTLGVLGAMAIAAFAGARVQTSLRSGQPPSLVRKQLGAGPLRTGTVATVPDARVTQPSAEPAPTARDVRIELQNVPSSAHVRLDGLLQDSNVLSVPRGDAPRRIEVQLGAHRRRFTVHPDRDRSIIVDIDPAERARAPEVSRTPDARLRARRTPGGIGAVELSREF